MVIIMVRERQDGRMSEKVQSDAYYRTFATNNLSAHVDFSYFVIFTFLHQKYNQ